MLECVKLKVSVHNDVKTLVPTMFVRLETAWVNRNTCAQFSERILRENGHETIANQLDDCQVVFKCFRMVGIHNAFGNKRARVGEEMRYSLYGTSSYTFTGRDWGARPLYAT